MEWASENPEVDDIFNEMQKKKDKCCLHLTMCEIFKKICEFATVYSVVNVNWEFII